jgi:hypothetical protein
VDDGDASFPLHESIKALQILPRRSTAVIADAPEDGHITVQLECEGHAFLQPGDQVIPLRVVKADDDAQGQNFRAVQPAPAIQVRG